MIRKRYIVAGSVLGDVIRIGVPGANTHPAHAHTPTSTSAARAVPSSTPAAAVAQPLFTAELTAWDDGAGCVYQAAEAELDQAGSDLKSGNYAALDTDGITLSADADIALAGPMPPAGDAGYGGWLSGPGSAGTDVALGDCANAAASLDVANGRFSSWVAATQAAAS